jgi:hypothetical protein
MLRIVASFIGQGSKPDCALHALGGKPSCVHDGLSSPHPLEIASELITRDETLLFKGDDFSKTDAKRGPSA